jgi:hypothetical protein
MGKRTANNKYKKYTKDELSNEIKRFVDEFEKVPTSKDFEKLEGYPSRKTFTNIFGNFNDAIRYAGFEPVGMNHRDNKIKYNKEYLLNKITENIDTYEKIPTMKDMTKFLGYEPKIYYYEIFGSWNNALQELNLPLNQISHYTDEFLESEFRRFISEYGRIPTFREFNNNEYPSFWCYQNRFGSWNNAVKAYGYNIQSDLYNFEVLKDQLLNFCRNIKLNEKRNIITISDIENCKEIASYSCFRKHLKNNGYSIKSFLNEYGFDMLDEGSGMNYTFKDGEKIRSQYEFYFSNYLRNNLSLKYNINYFRDVKYKLFIDNYNKNSNCDYVINLNNKILYIEIAGMLRDHKKHYLQNKSIKYKTRNNYRINLYNKETMLKNNNLNYYILFPSDLTNQYLDSIFNQYTNIIKDVI